MGNHRCPSTTIPMTRSLPRVIQNSPLAQRIHPLLLRSHQGYIYQRLVPHDMWALVRMFPQLVLADRQVLGTSLHLPGALEASQHLASQLVKGSSLNWILLPTSAHWGSRWPRVPAAHHPVDSALQRESIQHERTWWSQKLTEDLQRN